MSRNGAGMSSKQLKMSRNGAGMSSKHLKMSRKSIQKSSLANSIYPKIPS
ncbi:MAG: hypothetical protein ACRCWQ_08095 [Bacilli bacterium]